MPRIHRQIFVAEREIEDPAVPVFVLGKASDGGIYLNLRSLAVRKAGCNATVSLFDFSHHFRTDDAYPGHPWLSGLKKLSGIAADDDASYSCPVTDKINRRVLP